MSLRSVEADSILLCRSSKLTDGKKSYDVVDCSFGSSSPFRPKERSEWLLDEEALSIGASCATAVEYSR